MRLFLFEKNRTIFRIGWFVFLCKMCHSTKMIYVSILRNPILVCTLFLCAKISDHDLFCIVNVSSVKEVMQYESSEWLWIASIIYGANRKLT